ncbi:MAG: hypothetical protein RIR91_945 [Verrucomicrobiota bacterium]|jgi:HK97 family phage portal protein
MGLLSRLRHAFTGEAAQQGPEVNASLTGSWAAFEGSMLRSSSGISVSPDSAMRLSAVYRSATLISGAVSTLPLPVFRRLANGARENAGQTDVWWLLNESPSPGWSAAAWWEYATLSMLLRGDAFARVHVNPLNRPVALEPIDPSDVLVEKAADGTLVYYLNQSGKKSRVPEEYMLHFPMPGFDGLRSPSVIRYAALQTIGTSLRTEEHAARLFETGAANNVVLETAGMLKPEQAAALRDAWVNTYGNAQDPRRVPLLLQGGTKASSLSLTAADAQLLETRRFHVEDIARAFGVPPWMIGAMDKTTSWGSGVEQAGIGFVVYTLNPHLHRIQNELNRKLFRRAGTFVEFAVEGLMQGDLKTQADYFRQALGGSQGPGWMTVNEVRRLKNLPPIPGGDEMYTPTGVLGDSTNAAPATAPGAGP